FLLYFFFCAAAPTWLYTLSLHDALPICRIVVPHVATEIRRVVGVDGHEQAGVDHLRQRVVLEAVYHFERHVGQRADGERDPFPADRKSTRLNSSHVKSSYAVFCLKKKTT